MEKSGNKKSFNEIYEEIHSEGEAEISKLKAERNASIAFFAIFLLLSAIAFVTMPTNMTLITVLVVVTIICLIKYFHDNTKYKTRYKEIVMEKMVRLYDSNLIFEPKNGITSHEYNMSGFDTKYDRFYAEDLIKGNIFNSNFRMSQVKTIERETTTDSEGNTTTSDTVTFLGLFGYISLNGKYFGDIHILPNTRMLKTKSARIEIDSAEFEKYYDFMASDKVRAMQVFTSDVIEMLNRFKEKTKCIMEIRMERTGRLFFRIRCGDAFEAPKLKEALDYETIYKYYSMIDLPLSIIGKIMENVNSLE